MSQKNNNETGQEKTHSNTDEFLMSPKVDFCFCELMADDDIRRGFIAALLDISPEEIETRLLPTHLRKERGEDKLGILDVRVLMNGITQIDLEIQVAPFKSWEERSLYYLCKMYTEQIHEGEEYQVLQKCIHVGILDFTILKDYKGYYSCFHLWEDNRHIKYSDKLELHVLELPKLEKYSQVESDLLRWARFINAEKKEVFKMIAATDPYLKKAYDRLVNISADEEKRLEYEARQKAIRDYKSQMRSSWEDGWEAGEKEGREAGEKEGREEGRWLNLIGQIQKKVEKGVAVSDIADMLETEVHIVNEFYQLIQNYPNADQKGLYELWKEQNPSEK